MRTVPAALLCLLAVSCVPSKRREVSSPSWLGSGEILVVGRVVLTPPLAQEEQSLSWITEEWRGKVMVVVGDTPTPIPRPFKTSEYRGRVEAPPDRVFSVALPAESFFIRGCIVPLDLSGGPPDQALLPGGWRVDVRPEDRAVYIGTLHYRRDEFWKVTGVEVEDEYESVSAECQKRWGPGVTLRKALATPVRREERER